MRKAMYAGQFYSGDFTELDKSIRESFEGELGPAVLPGKKREGEIKGVIVPHAGYIFSGQCAAWAYKKIAESKFAHVYVILGLSHMGYGSCISLEDWDSPFGAVKVDERFAKIVMEKTGLSVDEEAHQEEHSIEVQIPFLQFASRDKMNDLRILPIMIGNLNDYEKIGAGIKTAIEEYGHKVVVICSSDFTHYGENYGYYPFETDVKEKLKELDDEAISLIKKKDSKGFLQYIDKTGATICGKGPIAVFLESVDFDKARVLMHYSSGEIVGDYSSCVDYVSMIFK